MKKKICKNLPFIATPTFPWISFEGFWSLLLDFPQFQADSGKSIED